MNWKISSPTRSPTDILPICSFLFIILHNRKSCNSMSCRIIHCLSSDLGGDGGVWTLVQTWNQQAFYMLSHWLGFRAATGSRQPIAALSSEFRTAHRGTARPIPDFLCTTLSKRLGTGQWGDVSSTPLWRGLSDSTVLQIKQRERSCYFRQL